VQYRITAAGDGSTLEITHRAFGLLDPAHNKDVDKGWQNEMDRIKKHAEKK